MHLLREKAHTFLVPITRKTESRKPERLVRTVLFGILSDKTAAVKPVCPAFDRDQGAAAGVRTLRVKKEKRNIPSYQTRQAHSIASGV